MVGTVICLDSAARSDRVCPLPEVFRCQKSPSNHNTVILIMQENVSRFVLTYLEETNPQKPVFLLHVMN